MVNVLIVLDICAERGEACMLLYVNADSSAGVHSVTWKQPTRNREKRKKDIVINSRGRKLQRKNLNPALS